MAKAKGKTAAKKTATKKAPVAKKAPSKKAPAAKTDDSRGAPRGPRGMDLDKSKITYVETPNPKREGTASHARFAKYKKGMTVAQALKAGFKASNLRWDMEADFIKIKVVAS